MRKILSMLLLLAMGAAAIAQEKYTIRGKIEGESEGSKVILIYSDYTENKRVDSTYIHNGEFLLEGSLETPAFHRILIDRTAKGETSSYENWKISDFYLENSDIRFEANLDSMTSYFRQPHEKRALITGSKTEDEHQAFRASLAEKYAALRILDSEYMEKYHLPTLEGVYHTAEGIRIMKAMQPIENDIQEATVAYIRNNPGSVVAYDLARLNFLGMFVELTVPQIEELEALVKNSWEGTSRYAAFLELSERAKKTALQTKYQDFELRTPEGDTKRLSSVVPQGQYCMLEFWASWCAPCRAEIPHLVKIHEKYKDAGFHIVSISLDEKDQHWKRAMADEQMVWQQLSDPKGFSGEIAQAYNIVGIPYAILLDPDGRIVNFNMRGAKLDAALLDIYGF